MAEILEARPPATARSSWLIGAFMFGHFTHHVSNTLLAPLQPLIRDGFGLSYAQSGLLVSAFSLSQGFSQPPIGLLADRVGSRRVVVFGLMGTALLTFVIGLAGEYWHLLVLLVGLGLVGGTYHAPAGSLLAQAFPRPRRGAALGMHIVGGHLSFIATPLLAAGLAGATLNWRTPYLAFAGAPLLAGLLLLVALPRIREREERPTEKPSLLSDLWEVLRGVGPLLSLAIVFQMLYAAVMAFLALYLVDAHQLDVRFAAMLVAVPSLSGLFGAPTGGFLSDRIGRKPVIVLSLVCLGPLLLLFTNAPTEFLIPILLLMGFLGSARMPVIEGLLLDRAASHRRATTLGAYYLVAQELGGMMAPVLGALAGAWGIAQAFGAVALATTTLSALIALLHRKL